MQGRNCQTIHRFLSKLQCRSAEALVTHQACLSSPAVQRLSDTASQSAPAQSQAEPQTADARVAQLTYSQNLRDLRKKWQEQRAQKLAAKAKADAIKDANKAKSVEAHRRNLSAMKDLRMQIHEEKRRLQMAELVRDMLQSRRDVFAAAVLSIKQLKAANAANSLSVYTKHITTKACLCCKLLTQHSHSPLYSGANTSSNLCVLTCKTS